MKNLFYFNDNWTSIGIKLSGGADSSIILYAISDYYKNNDNVKIYAMTLDTEYKPWYSQASKKVLDKVFELTGKKVEHIIKYSDLHYNKETANYYIEEQSKLVQDCNSLYKFDSVYSGLTSNPPEDLFLKKIRNYYKDDKMFNIAEQHIIKRDFNRDGEKNIYKDNIIYTGNWHNIRPLVHGDKILTYNVYKYFNRLEDLFSVTYSCETRYQDNKLENKSHHDWEHCGYCFFCCERIYGFDTLI